MVALGGEICIDVRSVESTVIVDSPVTEPNCAVMIAVPPDSAVTVPPPPTLATVDADEAQLTTFEIT